MQSSDIPDKFNIPFADAAGAGYIRPIPEASQIGVNDGFASLHDGFVPLNATPVDVGGIPPFMQDFNGILRQTTAWAQWVGAGGPVRYDPTFQAAIGGYPLGAVVMSAATNGVQWLSTVENNLSNPDASGAGWVPWIGLAASVAEIQAGTVANKAVTPAGLAGAGVTSIISSSLGANGFIEYSNGIKECWGLSSVPAGSTLVVPLPKASTTWLRVTLGAYVKSTTGAEDNTGLAAQTLTNFTLRNWENTTIQVNWMTKGV